MPRRDGNTNKPERPKHGQHRMKRRTRAEREAARLAQPDARFKQTLGRNPIPTIHALIVSRVDRRRKEYADATPQRNDQRQPADPAVAQGPAGHAAPAAAAGQVAV